MHKLNNTTLIALSHLSLLRISGTDSKKFLQGQLTCNVDEVTDRESRLAAHCNLQGRMVSLGRLLQLHSDYYYQIPSSIAENCLAQLKKYGLFSKINLELSKQTPIGIAGPAAETLLLQTGLPCPSLENTLLHNDQFSILREFGKQPRFVIYGPADRLNALYLNLSEKLALQTPQYWQLLDIEAGIGSLCAETQNSLLPQELNLDKLQGVSFTKGCYLGQEVIARLHYLGKLKKQLWRIAFSAPQTLGSTIYHHEHAIGQLVCAAPQSPQNYLGLAVLQDNEYGEFKFANGSVGLKTALAY